MEIKFKHLAIPKKVKGFLERELFTSLFKEAELFSQHPNKSVCSQWVISALTSLTFDSAPDFPVMLTFEAQMTLAHCWGEAPNKCGSLFPPK